MDSDRRLRAVVVGCGRRGLDHVRALSASPRFELIAAVDPDPDARGAAGVPGFCSVGEVGAFDHAAIAAPLALHAGLIEAAIGAGARSILIEKPLSASAGEAERVVEACAARGVLLAVGHHWRFTPELVALRELIAAGEIGSVRFYRGIGYGNLLDQGSHLVDAIRWVAGGARATWAMAQADDDPQRVGRFAIGERGFWRDPQHPSPMWMTQVLALEDGVRVALETGLAVEPGEPGVDPWHRREIFAVGSEGVAQCRPGFFLRVTGRDGRREMGSGLAALTDATRQLHDDVADALREGRAPRCAGGDARETVRALEMCLRSADESRLVTAAASSRGAGVRFSVLFPLVEDRGHWQRSLESWLAQEELGGARYEVLVAGDRAHADPELLRALRPDDRFIDTRERVRPGLYDLMARAAQGEVLVITESHCTAEPDFLGQLDRYLRTHEVSGALCHSIGVSPNFQARLEQQFTEQAMGQFARDGDPRKLVTHACALDRRAYLEAGGFDARFDDFGEMVLAARLRERGHRLGYARQAIVRHHYSPDVRTMLAHLEGLIAGESEFRASPAGPREVGWTNLRDRWIGLPGQGIDLAPELAGALWSTSSFAELGRLFPDWWHGTRALAWWLRLARALVVARWPWTSRADRGLAFREVWETAARVFRLRWLRHVYARRRPDVLPGRTPIEEVRDEDLLGFGPLEERDGRAFRWSGRHGVIRVWRPRAGVRRVTLHTGALRGWPVDYLARVFANGHPVPPGAIWAVDDEVRITIEPPWLDRRPFLVLVLTVDPLITEPSDTRELGLPLTAIQVDD